MNESDGFPSVIDATSNIVLQPNCTVISGVEIECRLPAVEVPDEFRPRLDDSDPDDEDSAASRRRRKRNSSGVVNWIDWLSSSSSRSRREVALDNGSGAEMTVHVVLWFDGYRINLTKTVPDDRLVLRNPPTIQLPDSVIPFYRNTSNVIEIRVRRAYSVVLV